MSNRITDRKRGYLEAIIVSIILVILIYILDLPKVLSFSILGIVGVYFIVWFEMFVFESRGKE